MESMVRTVCRLQTNSLNVSPHRLAPVEAAATHLYMWQHLVHGLPHCRLEIADDAFNVELLVVCALIQHSFQHSTVVRRAFSTHYYVRQTRGTCFAQSSTRTKAWMDQSWVYGALTTWKVASTYQQRAFRKSRSRCFVYSIMWRFDPTLISQARNHAICAHI